MTPSLSRNINTKTYHDNRIDVDTIKIDSISWMEVL